MGTVIRILADAVVVIHFTFLLFVVLGGLLVLRWRWVMWLHLPAVVWGGVFISLFGWECPLTPLENELRHQAGQAGYEGGFIDHYLLPIIYPAGFDRDVYVLLGVLVIVGNLLVYGLVLSRRLRGRLAGGQQG